MSRPHIPEKYKTSDKPLSHEVFKKTKEEKEKLKEIKKNINK